MKNENIKRRRGFGKNQGTGNTDDGRPGRPGSEAGHCAGGEKLDDMSYERGAVKKMENFGLRVQTYVFPEQISDSDFKAEFSAINRDPDVSGILLLRPLPKQIAETDIEKMIDPKKDLDGFPPANIAKVFAGDKTGFAPCTAEAVIEVLKANEIDMTGKNVTIVGRSMVVGRPLSMLMLKENATVTICHTRTRDLETECRRAEILVAAAGKAKMLDGRHVGQDAIVIDVGIMWMKMENYAEMWISSP